MVLLKSSCLLEMRGLPSLQCKVRVSSSPKKTVLCHQRTWEERLPATVVKRAAFGSLGASLSCSP